MKKYNKSIIRIAALVIFIAPQSCKDKTAIPTLTTVAISEITQTSAISGGKITDNGGSEITARGVCWNTNHNPDTGSGKSTEGSGNGTFVSSISGLAPDTKYYVRAYATNSEGTAYGNELAFSSLNSSPAAGLVAYYPFNGNANDVSGNGNSGVVFGATLTEDRFGSPNSAYSFNGNSDYILVNDSPSLDINGGITLTGWRYITGNSLGRIVRKVNTWGPPIGGYILSSAQDYINSELQLDTYPDIVIITRKDSIFQLNTWGFVAMTYDGQSVSLYYNGSRIHSYQVTGQINTNDNPLYIGSSEGVEYFAGKIDDVRIYNRALNESEIKNLYELTK
jgi:hypothetical protein